MTGPRRASFAVLSRSKGQNMTPPRASFQYASLPDFAEQVYSELEAWYLGELERADNAATEKGTDDE